VNQVSVMALWPVWAPIAHEAHASGPAIGADQVERLADHAVRERYGQGP